MSVLAPPGAFLPTTVISIPDSQVPEGKLSVVLPVSRGGPLPCRCPAPEPALSGLSTLSVLAPGQNRLRLAHESVLLCQITQEALCGLRTFLRKKKSL